MFNEEIVELVNNTPNISDTYKSKMLLEITRRYSFSFATISFAFISIPLGLVSRRKETSSGLILSIIVASLYFVICALAEHFDTALGANLVMWSPNLICVILGLYLFRCARFK